MNSEQEFTPKYWMVHNTKTDDVLVYTAHKSRDGAIFIYNSTTFGKLFDDSDDLCCDLFEIGFALLKKVVDNAPSVSDNGTSERSRSHADL